jgi:hypothetical protein
VGRAEVGSSPRRPGGFGADKEVALALREPVGAAQRRIHHARRMQRLLPTTRRLFREGAISQRQADAIVEATSGVADAELAAAVEDKVLTAPGALARTARELARSARQALTRLDPVGAEERARAARQCADVVYQPGEDGMATTVMEAPVEEALIVKTAADAYAATCKAAGDDRRIGVLRTEGLARICGDYLKGRPATRTAPRTGGLPIEIGIVIDVETAFGRRELPPEVPGHGIVPREVVARMITEEQARLRLYVIDEGNGRLVHRSITGYRPTPAQIAQVRAQYVYSAGPGSQVLAARTDTDHVVPYPQGPTAIGNLIPNDRTWHNGHTLDQLSVSVDDSGVVEWTSVLGQSRRVMPYDYRMHVPEPGAPAVGAEPRHDDEPPPF